MKYKFFIATVVLLFIPFLVEAATLSLTVDKNILEKEARVELSLNLIAEDDGVNAVGGEIIIKEGNAEFASLQDGGSIVSAWVERPRIENNKIIFSGIIPGGFYGQYSPFQKGPGPGVILKFSLNTKSSENVILAINNLEAFSGNGEPVNIKLDPTALSVKTDQATNSVKKSNDQTAPRFVLSELTNLIDSKKEWYVSFMAEDAESGIDYYEIQESDALEPSESAWIKTENPYRLKDQSKKSRIFIKAVNRNGQSSITTIEPSTEIGLSWLYLLAGVIIFVIVFIYGFYYYRRKKL